MAVTQYIGSRYVPLFADPIEWSDQNTYEPLTIVLHQGNSYTSKQAVPKDIDISNEDFWAETGNYNAQIETYRREVVEVAEVVDDLESIIPADSFDETNTVKSYVDASISELTESLETLTSDFESEIKSAKFSSGQRIQNASLLYRDLKFLGSVAEVEKPYRQGMCVFPLNDSWESGVMYAASVVNPGGLDMFSKLEIIDIQARRVVNTIDLGETHGGVLFYREGVLYVPMYKNDATTSQVLRSYSVSNPYSPDLLSEVSYAGRGIDVPFGKTEEYFICYGPKRDASKQQGVYRWDGLSNAEWLFDISPISTGLGKRTQPYCYDEINNLIIVPFADCCGYVAYDMNGKLQYHKAINGEIGFVNVGELETVIVRGEDVWFGGFHNTALKTIMSYGIWHWSPTDSGISEAPQGRTGSGAYNIRLAPTNTAYPMESEYSTSQTINLASPDDALNMARYIGTFKNTNIFQTADYDCCLVVGNYKGQFSPNSHLATNGYYIYNFEGIIHGSFKFADVDPTAFMSDFSAGWSAASSISNIPLPVAVLILESSVTITQSSGAYAHDDTFLKFRCLSSDVKFAFGFNNGTIVDSVFEKSHIVAMRQPKMSYCILINSLIQNLTFNLATFDSSVYTIGTGVSLLGCLIPDGIDSTTALLPDRSYYIGGLDGSLNAWHILPLAGATRLSAVTDRLHSTDLYYCYMDNNAMSIDRVKLVVSNSTLKITAGNQAVSSFNAWT